KIVTIQIHIRNNDLASSGSFSNRNDHATDQPGACDEHIFAEQIERERSVHRVAQQIETEKHIERNRGISVPTVVLRNRYELRPRTGTIDAHALCVWAKMTAPGQAIAAMSTSDVPLA